MKLLLVAAVLFIGLLAIAATTAAGRSADREKPYCTIREERVGVPPATPKPETWTRYDVPLDDDLQRYLWKVCRKEGVDPALALAVIERESGFQADQLGDGGESYGLMQIHIEDHRERCIALEAYNLFNPYDNVRVGVNYLAELLAEGKGLDWALMAYNAGPPKADQYTAEGYLLPYAADVKALAEKTAGTGTEVENG